MNLKLFVIIFNILFFTAPASYAYFGPGLGIGAISVVILFLVTILLLVFSIFAYPIKKAYKFLFKKKEINSNSEKKTKE